MRVHFVDAHVTRVTCFIFFKKTFQFWQCSIELSPAGCDSLITTVLTRTRPTNLHCHL